MTHRAGVNPFSTRFVRPGSIEYRFHNRDSLASPAEIVRAIHSLRYTSIVGPHGTGKSTLLRSLSGLLSERFDRIEWLQLHTADVEGQSRLRSWKTLRSQRHLNAHSTFERLSALSDGRADRTLMIVDGIEQLSSRDQARLVRKAKQSQHAILATSHTDCGGLQTIYRTQVCGLVVRQIVDELLRDSPSDVKRMITAKLDTIDLGSISNVRDYLFHLYDVVADSSSISD